MNEMRRNTLVGGFMVIGLAALAWLMTSFGELPAFLGTGEYELIMVVKDPRGIGDGTPIFLSGVQIGRVKELRFKDPTHLDAGVHILGAVKKEFVIPDTATAIVQPAGMGLGRGRIDLSVAEGQAPPLAEGQEIEGVMGNPWGDMIPDTLLTSIDRSVSQFGDFVEALTPVADDLHDLFERHTVEAVDQPAGDTRRLTANISTVVERFDKTLKTFNDTFGDPAVKEGWLDLFANIQQTGDHAREALENIKNTSAELRTNLQSISLKMEGGIDDTTRHINEIADGMRPILENTAKLTASLAQITEVMRRGEGSAGMFLKDPRLYESLLITCERLTELVDTIQRIFRRFEMNGAIRLDVPTALGDYRKSVEIPGTSR